MEYTDSEPTNIKKVHVSELADAVNTMATNKKVSITSFTPKYDKVYASNIKALQTAINELETKFSNNCCQANCCQTCQGCQKSACQSCQTCQRCQSQCIYNCSCDC